MNMSMYILMSRHQKKKYTPDFYIMQGEHTAWLEHYALTESGYSNVFTPQQLAMYKKAIRDKRTLHSGYKTTLIETWSLYNDRRPLMDHLKEALEKEGFQLKPRNLEERTWRVYQKG